MTNNYHKLNIIEALSSLGIVWQIGVVYNSITDGKPLITFIFIALVFISLSVCIYQSGKK